MKSWLPHAEKRMPWKISLGSILITFWLNLQICHCFLGKQKKFQTWADAHNDWSPFNNWFCSLLHWVKPIKWKSNSSCSLKSSWSIQIILWLIAPVYWRKKTGILYIWHLLSRIVLKFYLIFETFSFGCYWALCCHREAHGTEDQELATN